MIKKVKIKTKKEETMVTPLLNTPTFLTGYTTQSNPKELIEACKADNEKLVESILQNSSSAEIKNAIEQRDKKGNSALHFASKNGNVKIVNLLILAGADIHAENEANQTPLHQACQRNQKEIVQVLLTKGANPNIFSNSGKNALHTACYSDFDEIVELLLKSGAVENVNLADKLGATPLSLACIRKNRRILELLIQAKADVNQPNKSGALPLHLTCIIQSPEIAKLLIDAGADVNAINPIGESPLLIACANGAETIVEFLLEGGADRNFADTNKRTPLHVAVKDSPQIVRLLLKDPEKIDLEATNQLGKTPLMSACLLDKTEVVALLLAAGANKEISDNDVEKPLDVACRKENKQIIEMLLRNDLINHAAWNTPAILPKAKETPSDLFPPISSGPTPISSSSSMVTDLEQ